MTKHINILTAFLLAAGALAASATGCELVASVDRSKIGGGGSSTGGSTTTTTTSMGGSDAGPMCGDAGTSCTTAATCTTGTTSACVVADCTNSCCAVSNAGTTTKCTDNGGAVCDGAGKCVACNVDADCTPTGTVCAVPKCDTAAHTCSNTNATKGTACEGANNVCDGAGACVNKHCTDGVLDADETDVDCGGSCGGTCTDTPQQKCKVGGDCKSGVCADNSGGTQLLCQVPTCSDGVINGNETDKDCGGAAFGTAAACAPCGTNKVCAMNSDCASQDCQSLKCTLKPDGNTCTGDTQCNSGKCLTDDTATSTKICCNPTAGCTAGTTASCGFDGNCKHDGSACADYPATQVCTAASCTDGASSSSATGAALCSGSGSCGTGTVTQCGNYKCGGLVCKTTCTVDTDCATGASGNYCNASNQCVPKLTKGTACATANQCQTGFCTDGVCCDKACSGTCQACKASLQNSGGTDGTCAAALDGTNPHSSCTAQSPLVCGNTGTCTAGACAKVSNGTNCGTACASGAVTTSTCNGTGNCIAGSPVTCTGNFICASMSMCKSTCAMDSDCNLATLPACDTGACVQCTSTNVTACSAGAPLCGNLNDALKDKCVECNIDGDCAMPKTCTLPAHTCN